MKVLPKPFRVFLASGESSGDGLGAGLMRCLKVETEGAVTFCGIGGPLMAGEGLEPLFPSTDLAIMGPTAVVPRLPHLWRRLQQTVRFIVNDPPHVVILIDCPEFTQRVAKRVRRLRPDIAIIKYVAPQAWGWRPGRVPRMRRHLDQIMAFLPFEPEFYARLNGPETTYVGHPMIEKTAEMRPSPGEQAWRERRECPVLLVLPGSRRSEIDRLMPIFGETLAIVRRSYGPVDVVIPAVPHLAEHIRDQAKKWTMPVRIVLGEAAKWQAFRQARAALAASGTVTLELAVSGVPAIVAYKIEAWFAFLMRRLITTNTVVLANLVLGENVVPEFLQEQARPDWMATSLHTLLAGGLARERQLEAFKKVDELMGIGQGNPSERAARVVIDVFQRRAETGT